ncbi:MAG: 4-alpha-glucanotransferase [Bifidobacterium pseudocatenulatum]
MKEQEFWLEDYCLYMAIKISREVNRGTSGNRHFVTGSRSALEEAKRSCWEDIEFYRFQQYEFFKQWNDLHSYANRNGIRIIGDLPIYVAFDSADTWSVPKLFQFT